MQRLRLKRPMFIGYLLTLICVGFFAAHQSQAQASSFDLGTTSQLNTGVFNGTEASSKAGELRLEALGTSGTRVFKTPFLTLGDQTSVVSDGTYLYLKHSADNLFVRYQPSNNTWKTLADAPRYSYQGSDMKIVGTNIYAIFGGYQKAFYKYSIPLNTWTKVASLPDLVYSGASLATDGTNIYALRGAGTSDFWKYTVSSNTWTTVSSTPATISTGGSLVYSGGYLYTPRGANTTTFYRYDISGNAWTTLSAAPGTLNSDGNIAVNGGYIYILRGSSTNTFYRYSIAADSWTTLSNTPQVTGFVGVVYNSGDGYLYVFRGNNTQEMWKYDIASNSFVGQADLPNTPGTGSDMINDQGYLYYVRGNSSTNLYRYSLSAGTWSGLLAAFPATMVDDVKGASVGAYLYFVRGSSTATLYRYDTVGNSFTTLAVAPASIGAGATISYPGSGNYLYISRGLNTTVFYRYNISTDIWDDAGAADLPSDSPAGIGSRMITDGTNIYYISGNGTSRLLKYTVGSNTWSVINNVPFSTYYGTDMNYYQGKLYLQAGYYKSDFWEYTLSTNTWRRLPDLESLQGYGQGPYNGAALASDGGGNLYSTYGANSLWWQSYTINSFNYPTSGTWTSDILDLTYASALTSLSATSQTPGGSSVSFETRTSADKSTWSSWQLVSGGAIASSPNRYIQVRATLNSSSDQVQTPIISGMTISYTGDGTAPTNPTSFTAKSQSVSGVTLTTSTSYSYANPYFSWSGASDAQTAVAGYYVYFGTDNTADPVSQGALTTSTTYTVTTPMTSGNTYFLRLATKDSDGNVSTPVTEFSYVYNGVNAQSLTKTLSSDFSGGTLTDMSTAGDQIKLASTSGFWQQNRLSLVPATISNGAAIAYVSSTKKLYTFRGAATTSFYEYDTATDIWTTKAVAPATVTTGGALAAGPSGYVYGARGNNTTTFWRYDPSTDTWDDSAAADAPQPLATGSSLAYDGTRYIYALKGNSDDTFMRYDPQTDTWDTLANTDFGAPSKRSTNIVSSGGDIAIGDSDTLFAIQGGSTHGFSQYRVSSDSWTSLADLPAGASSEGSQIEYDSTANAVYYYPANGKTALFKYDIGADSWSELPDAPATLSTASSMRNVGGLLYIIRGGSTQNFYVYDTTKDSWKIPNDNLFGTNFRGSDLRTFTTGAQVIKGGSNLYYIARGANDSLFISYDATSGTSTKLTDIPGGMTTGSTMVYDSTDNRIYAVLSSSTRRFFVYDITNNYWYEETTDPIPAVTGTGAAMRYDGSRYIYVLRGSSTTTFYRYDTQATAGSRWTTLSVTPGTMGSGASLVIKNGYIYALRGNSQVMFYRYDISGSTWSDPAVADLPTGVTVGADGFLVDGGTDTLYACRALNTSTCYQYSISNNSWSQIADAPANITSGGSANSNGTDTIYAIAGAGTNTYNNGLYSYIMQTDTSSFKASGSFVAPTLNLGSVYKFANISVNYTSAANATLTVKTRTSTDNSAWGSWSQASELRQIGSTYSYKVNSQADDYIQIEFDLTSGDGVYSGVISDYTLNYYSDSTPPSNASSLSSYSNASHSASLTTNNWYNYSSPEFSWPAAEATGGASDTTSGSGVTGYYVYFGTDSNADPKTAGSLQSTTSYTPSSLTSGSTYYLRIKTVDDAGNVTAGVWQAFVYKFDNVVPENPTVVTSDPPGYTATNSFDFAWSGATDSASLVGSYCYKTALNGTEVCGVTATSVASVSAGGTGASTFYVKAVDNAGNKAASFASVSYYYSSTAPSAPQSLSVTPTSNTINEFAFSWSPPSVFFGAQANLLYYYSVNAIPTSQNVNSVGISHTYLSSGAYATVAGNNIMYVVAKDEAGNIDYNNYASVTFNADTSAPGISRNVDISDVSVKSTENWRLAVSWDAPLSSGSGVANYKVYRAASKTAVCSLDDTPFSYVASTTTESYVDTNLTQQNYAYCIKACDSTNNCSADSSTVTMLPSGKWTTAPTLTASPSAVIKTKSAVISWATNRTSNSFVKYGTKSGEYGNEVGSSDQLAAHVITLSGLNPGTTYYYQVLWTDEDGNLGSSDEQSLTTGAAPFISNVKTTNISLYSAYVGFTVNNASSVKVNYGKTLSYGGVQTLATSKDQSDQNVILSDLEEGTIYHLQIVAEDEEGNTFSGDDYTFKTLPVPKVNAFKIQEVSGMPTATLRILWTTNTPVSSILTYYPTANPEQARDQIALQLTNQHEMIIKDLKDSTQYTVLIKGKDSAGNDAVAPAQTIKTAVDFRPPGILNLDVETTIVGVGQDAKAQAIVSWDTDEPSTGQVNYAEGTGSNYTQATQEDSNLATNHVVTITGLTPAKIYHLQATSKDKSANVGKSYDTVVVTPKSTKAALDLVIQNLSATFGFLKGFGQ